MEHSSDECISETESEYMKRKGKKLEAVPVEINWSENIIGVEAYIERRKKSEI